MNKKQQIKKFLSSSFPTALSSPSPFEPAYTKLCLRCRCLMENYMNLHGIAGLLCKCLCVSLYPCFPLSRLAVPCSTIQGLGKKGHAYRCQHVGMEIQNEAKTRLHDYI